MVEDPGNFSSPTRTLARQNRLDTIAQRYKVERVLSQGPGYDTLFAIDLTRDQGVVVRRAEVELLSPAVEMRLSHEASILAQVSSDAVAPTVDFGRDEDHLYWVRPFVPGISLRALLARGPLSVPTALAVGRTFLSGLHALHTAGVLHRNLRPANLIVDDARQSAILTDAGMLRSVLYGSEAIHHSVEDALYVSPEQAGSLVCDVTEPSDLYAAGAILYECLAGRPPCDGDTVGAILLAHMTNRVPELRSLGITVPRTLDEVVLRLLRKDPRDRYQSVDAALADLDTIATALAVGEREPEFVVGLQDRRRTITEPAFVARAAELEALDAQIRRSRQGKFAVAVVESESGGGKSRLLEELAQRGARQGLWVFHGQGSSEVGQRPFQILDGVVGQLVAAKGTDAARVRTLVGALESEQEAVSAALPELGEALGLATGGQLGPEAYGEARSIQALSHFLDCLGTESAPALVILDDCQWCDGLAARLLAHWTETRAVDDRRGHHLCLVVGFRSEEVPADHTLRRLRSTTHLKLHPFGAEDVRRLAESMAGPLPEEIVELICRLSDGSPFMASAVLRGLIESGALVGDHTGWRIEPLALADSQSSRHAASFLSRRIELLPPAALELLSIAAILGKEFSLHTAAELAGQSSFDAITNLDVARKRHLVWVRPEQTQCAFVHDKIRSALLERIPAEERQKMHYRAAVWLRGLPDASPFDLAYHFDAAGKSDLALPDALRAAELARSRYALDIAEQQYRIARRGATAASAETRYRICEGLGDTLMLRGRYEDAATLLEEAATLAEGTFAEAQIRGKLGELAFKRGDMETATRSFEWALRLLGRRVPRVFPSFVALLVWEILVQATHSLFPRVFVGRRRQPSPADLLSWRLFSRLAHGYWFVRGKVHVLWTHLRGMNQSERYAPTLELAQAYSEHAPAMTLVPWYSRGIEYARRSLEIRRALADVWGQGQSLHYYAVVLYSASRFTKCVEKGREAVRLLERTGDYWEVHVARYQVAAALYRLGDLTGAIVEARKNYESGLALGDEQASGISLDVWSRAAAGRIPADIVKVELDRERPDAQGVAQVTLAEGVRLLAAGEPTRAADVFEHALRVARKAGVVNTYVTPNLAWLATARRIEAERQLPYAPTLRVKHLGRAQRAARQALRAAGKFQNDLPHALRELALIDAMHGRIRKARRRLEQSLGCARRQGAAHELAETQNWYVRLGGQLGWSPSPATPRGAAASPNDSAAGASMDSQSTGIARSTTLSLADRFDTVLDSGRRLASALSREPIFAEAKQAALRLLRGQHCLVLTSSEGPDGTRFVPTTGSSPAAAEILVPRCVAAGRPVSAADLTGNEWGEVFDEGSHLAVPIFFRGQAVACLYIAHRQVRNLFTADELRLAEFIATLTGAALENAYGFEELQRLNATLEQRVAERTAAAEAASDAKSRFLATVSHEIRTPMNGIIGMTELALTTGLTGQQRGYLHIVKQSANALLRLLNDILDLSKVEAGKLELECIAFDLRDLIVESMALPARAAAQKGLELVVRLRPDVPSRVIGDPGRLRQVLTNLAGNAVKFTDTGHVLVEVEVERTADRMVRLRCAVRDSGIGIPTDKQSCIFDSFQQADTSTTRRYGGTGLGLAICSQLVHLMSGEIWVESQPGHGSSFYFTAEFSLPDALPADSRPGTAALRSRRVLVAGRHDLTRATLLETLASWGMEGHSASSAKAAAQMLSAAETSGHPYDLLLVDEPVPVRDTQSLTAELVDLVPEILAPTILLLPPVPEALSLHANSFPQADTLTKPAKHSELFETALHAVGGLPDALEACLAGAHSIEHPLNVLLAEDGPINREVAIGILEMQGHRVTVAENGKEAVERTAAQDFDVVLMDLEMPELDGLSAATAIRLRESSGTRRVPIIAMTAHAVLGFQERCKSAGMDGYLTKPISPAELFAALDRVTRLSSSGHEVTPAG